MNSYLKLPLQHFSKLRLVRDFISSQVHAERRAKVVDYFLGSVWFLLGPLLEMLVYYVLVVVIFKRANFGDVPAFLGIMTGLIHYRFFQVTVQRCIAAIVGKRKILLQIKIESLSFVAIAFYKQVQDVKYFFFLYIVALIGFQYFPGRQVVFYPLVLVLLGICTWSISLLLSCAYVYFRDLQLIMQTVLRLLLYASPVIYPLTLIGESKQNLYFANPFATLFGLVQSCLLGMPFPPLFSIVFAIVFFVGLFFISHIVYEKYSSKFSKIM